MFDEDQWFAYFAGLAFMFFVAVLIIFSSL